MEKLKRALKINSKIMTYIGLNNRRFNSVLLVDGEFWNIDQEKTYPNVNGGNPVLELSNSRGEFIRIPKFLIDEKTEIINIGNKKKSFKI